MRNGQAKDGESQMGAYVVIDFEMCKVEKEQRKEFHMSREIIQIGAVLVDENGKVTKQFNRLVRPEYGRVDSFIEELTGISQDAVEDAPLLAEALYAFVQWLPEGNVTAVSWGMSDKAQLKKELSEKGIRMNAMDRLFLHWIDGQKMFVQKVGGQYPCPLAGALAAAGIESGGKAHDGLADAYYTALLLTRIV